MSVKTLCYAEGCVAYENGACCLFELPEGAVGPCKEYEKSEGFKEKKTIWFSRPPYGGGWDGATSFSRNICSGNYGLGANVTGDFIPVWIVARGVNSPIPGFTAITRVDRTWVSGRHRSNSFVDPGEAWAADGQRYQYIALLPREMTAQGTVDVLGRW